jgi:hypothetical protein
MNRPPIVVSPYDAELYGHWWYEGPMFLGDVFRQMHFDQHDVETITPGDYLDRYDTNQVATPCASSWGAKGYNDYWAGTHPQAGFFGRLWNRVKAFFGAADEDDYREKCDSNAYAIYKGTAKAFPIGTKGLTCFKFGKDGEHNQWSGSYTVGIAPFIPGYSTLDLNFINYDNDDGYYVYVYAHTRRETNKLVDEINRIADRTHQGGETGITVVSPDYWPLPWYLRDYRRVGYHGRMTASTEPIIIARQDQAAEVEATFGDRYYKVQSGFNTAGTFALRPGVELLLYTRRELAP